MEEIITLVNLINNSKFRTNGMLAILMEPGSRMRALYDAIVNGEVYDDESAKVCFPEFETANKLYTSKSRLKDRLMEAVLLMDYQDPDFSDRQKAYSECAKNWTAATLLLSKNARTVAIQIMEGLLRQTKRFEFTEMTLEILRALRLHASIITGNREDYKRYAGEIREYEEKWRMEREVEGLYADMMIEYVATRSDKKDMAELATTLFEQVEPFLAQCDTYKVHLFGRLIQLAQYENRNDYETTIALCEDAITFFKTKSYESKSVLQVFYYSLQICYLNLRRYDRFRALMAQEQNIFDKGTYNWYKLQELAFLTEMHSGNYQAALEVHQEVVNYAGFKTQSPLIQEVWKIFEAYLYFLKAAGRLEWEAQQDRLRIHKFLNEVQVYAKDKGGMNISVQVIQFMLTLAEGDFAYWIDKMEALAKYRTRYVKADQAARSHYFIKMLELVPKAQFKASALASRSADLATQLSEVPLEAANQNFEVEIIPYEALWEMVLSLTSGENNQTRHKTGFSGTK